MKSVKFAHVLLAALMVLMLCAFGLYFREKYETNLAAQQAAAEAREAAEEKILSEAHEARAKDDADTGLAKQAELAKAADALAQGQQLQINQQTLDKEAQLENLRMQYLENGSASGMTQEQKDAAKAQYESERSAIEKE